MKRNQTAPLYVNCAIQYQLAGSNAVLAGQGLIITGSELSFIAERAFEVGKAMLISTTQKNASLPPMTAFIEVIKTLSQPDGSCKITALIKSIKGN